MKPVISALKWIVLPGTICVFSICLFAALVAFIFGGKGGKTFAWQMMYTLFLAPSADH